jgi:hypothetical protein
LAVPDIILPRPYVLIQATQSNLGLLPVRNSTIKFGSVVLAYDTSDRVLAGQQVMFDENESNIFLYGSTQYWLVKDEFVTGQENVLP